MFRKIASLISVTLIVLTYMTGGSVLGKGVTHEFGWTDEDAAIMEKAWCDYNKGREFAAANCEEYWNGNKESE